MATILLFALATAVNPTMLAAVSVMLTLERPKRLLLGYLLGGMLVSVACGLALLASSDTKAFSTSKTKISPTIDLILGAVALLVAYLLWTDRSLIRSERLRRRRERRREAKQAKGEKKPWSQRVLGRGSARVAFAVGALFNLPGLYYLLAISKIDKGNYGTGVDITVIAIFNLVMFLPAEVPLVGYVLAPERTTVLVDRFTRWLTTHIRQIGVAIALAAGVYLVGRGVLGLLS